MNKHAWLTAVLGLISTHAAWAADEAPHWYVGGSIGSTSVSDQDANRASVAPNGVTVPSFPLLSDMNSDTSYSLVAGYGVTPFITLEGEYAHRSNTSKQVVGAGNKVVIHGNQIKMSNDSLLVNALYTFRELGTVQPYFGVGLGPTRMKASATDSLGTGTDDGWTVAYQVLIGADIKLGDRWSLYGQYQNFWVPNTAVAPATGGPISSRSVNTYRFNDYQAQTFSLGARFRF